MWIKRNAKQLVLILLLFAALVLGSSALFIRQMNEMTGNTTLNTVRELAAHDQVSIENFLERNWQNLEGIHNRMVIYGDHTIRGCQERMALERSTSDFQTLYLVDEDGNVYSDRYAVLSPEEMDIRSHLDTRRRETACRYDYELVTAERKEMLLYAVTLDNCVIEGVRFTHLAGLTPINRIQERMAIYSFHKDGQSRGYVSVIEDDGDYIVNIRRTASLNKRSNLYEQLDAGDRDEEWSNAVIRSKMEAEETFQFTYTAENGDVRFLYFSPVSDVDWYVVAAVDQSVFTDLSRAFIVSSLSMVLIAIVLSVCMLLAVMHARRKELAASADANARSVFLSNMSHEIRTPLNGITGLLHLIETHLDDDDPQQLALWTRKAGDTAQYLLSLVSDILDMSRLQAGMLDLNMAPFRIDTALDAVATMQSGNAQSRGVELTVDSQITVPCVVGDEVRLKQVLMNIVGNAAKFTPAGGTIALSARQSVEEDGRVTTVMTCADTGIGMSKEYLSRIWDSFTQEHNKVSNGTRGTGLGMPISKGIIDAMGGEITVESELGEGSTFTVTLHSEVADAAQLEEEKQAAQALPAGSLKLLVAEDNELNAEILLEILRDAGYEAELAEDGQKAVDLFAQSAEGEFDAILMDMQMPVLDGCQAAARIRKLDRADAGTVTILACTANSFQEDRDRALACGMDDFLTKPIDIDDMFAKLAAQAGKKAEKG